MVPVGSAVHGLDARTTSKLRGFPNKMASSPEHSVISEIYTWRVAAVALWGGALALWSAALWSLDWRHLLLSPTGLLTPWRILAPLVNATTWGTAALLAACCAPLLAVHVALIRTTEPPPLPLPGAAHSHSHAVSPIGLMCRAGGRLRDLAGVSRTAVFFLACVLAGAFFLGIFPVIKASPHASGTRRTLCTVSALFPYPTASRKEYYN
jgi:hypothetical protein